MSKGSRRPADAFVPFLSVVNNCCDAPSEVSLTYRNRAVDRIYLKALRDGPERPAGHAALNSCGNVPHAQPIACIGLS
ncbi:hypothetical protein BO443_80334 [Burkholderia orbicola]